MARNVANEVVLAIATLMNAPRRATTARIIFVELPVDEAYRPLYTTIGRMTLLLLAALGLALLGGVFLARMVVRPIHALQAVAARINSGDLSQ